MSLDISGLGHAIVDLQFKIDLPFLKILRKLNIEFGAMTLKDIDGQQELLRYLEENSPNPLKACGGSATNSIIAASSFGSNCHYSCKVSNDELGRFYKKDLDTNNIQNNILPEDSINPSGQSIIMITPDAERTMCTCLGISETFSENNLDIQGIAESKYLLMEGYLVTSDSSFKACNKAIKIAKDNKTKIAFSLSDLNIVSAFHGRMMEIINSDLDIIFCNQSEALSLTKKNSFELALIDMQGLAKTTFITKGKMGASICDENKVHQIKGVKANAIDTNGAGDMFAGAVLHYLSQGFSAQEAAKFGCFAASKNVEFFGPRLPKQRFIDIINSY